MTEQELLDLFAEALETDVSKLSPSKEIASIDEWDSVAWLTLMSLADERYGIEIPSKDIRSFVTVQDVIDFITSRAADAA